MSFAVDADTPEDPEDTEYDSLLGSQDDAHTHEFDSRPKPEYVKGPVNGFELLDATMNELGTGKFHYILMAICGYGFFADAAETQMLSLLYPVFMEEFNVDEEELALIGSLTNAGMFVGAPTFGKFSDQYGRKFAFIISLTICFIASFASSFATNVESFAAARFFLGIGYCGNLITCTTLLVEFIPAQARGWYVALTSVAFGAGAIIISAISWAVIPTIGWQWLIRIAAFMTLPVLLFLCGIPESPRFLLSKKRYSKVMQVMQKVAKDNKTQLPPYFNEKTLISLSVDDGDYEKLSVRRSLSQLFTRKSLKVLGPLFLVWFTNSFATTIMNWIPLEAEKHFPKDEDIQFKTALILASGILIGSIAQTFVVERVSRLFQIRGGFVSAVVCTTLLGFANTPSGLYAASFFLCFFEQFVIGTLYLYTPELFPTSVRVTAFGICQMGHRVAPIIAPFIIATTDSIGFAKTAYLFAGMYGVGLLFSLLLHVRTFKKPLVENAY